LEDSLKELQAHTSQTLKEFMQQTCQSTSPVSQELLLEDTLNAFRQKVNQPTQELKDATLANTKAIAKLKGQIDHLVEEFNIIEKDELQSQKMVRG
jgi:leucyl aminopeptidase